MRIFSKIHALLWNISLNCCDTVMLRNLLEMNKLKSTTYSDVLQILNILPQDPSIKACQFFEKQVERGY